MKREEHLELLRRVCLNYRTDWRIAARLRMHSPRICLVIPNQRLCQENSKSLCGTYSGMLLTNTVAKGGAPPTPSVWQMNTAVAIIRSILLLKAIILTSEPTQNFS